MIVDLERNKETKGERRKQQKSLEPVIGVKIGFERKSDPKES